MNSLGTFFELLRSKHGLWRNVFLVILAGLVALNLFVRPEEPHFGLDAYPGFFLVLGLIAGVLMIVILEKVIRPLLVRKEDFYGDV